MGNCSECGNFSNKITFKSICPNCTKQISREKYNDRKSLLELNTFNPNKFSNLKEIIAELNQQRVTNGCTGT